jgi:hypothetical protein
MRRSARAEEHREFRKAANDLDRRIAQIAAGTAPIIVGPWLAEVGYEVLYWIPFLRWFQDAYGVAPQRLVVVSRGGMEAAYGSIAGTYVDLFDLITPDTLVARNAERRSEVEGGGQKQSGSSAFDDELVAMVRARVGLGDAVVCHPSLMFNLFRHVWHDNLPFDVLWRHTRYVAAGRTAAPLEVEALDSPIQIPNDFIALKTYAGPALGTSQATQHAVRDLVARAASIAPVIALDAGVAVDEHRDFDVERLPGVISARSLMTARTNLGVQLALVARARFFLSTCGGLAWFAPFLGVPTVALYDDDRLLAPHLFVARQAGARASAAAFNPIDLRALGRFESPPLVRSR